MSEVCTTTIGETPSVSFTVLGKPRAKARPALVGRRYFKDDRTTLYENRVSSSSAAALGERPRFEGAISLQIEIYLEPAAYKSRTKREAMLNGTIRATQKPDVDNVVKAILDGCAGVLFRDDVQVVKLTATKAYSDVAKVVVTVSNI